MSESNDRLSVYCRRMARAIMVILIASMTAPLVCHGGGAAPDTARANEMITAALADAGNDPKNAAKDQKLPGCGKYVEGLRVVYDKAGYDFDATVRELPGYLKSAGNSQMEGKAMTAYMLTAVLVAGIQNECKGGPGEYEKYFDTGTVDALKAIFDQVK